MSAHRKTRKLVPVAAAAVSLMALAAGGGYAFAHSQTPAASLSDGVNLSAQQGAAGSHQVTLYACLAGGKISRVQAGSAPHCGRGSSVIRWGAQSRTSTVPTASPSATMSPSAPASSAPASSAPASAPASSKPTATASTPVSTSSSPATPVQDASCTTSSSSGSCGPYTYADISGSGGDGNETSVIQNVWNPTSGASQTLKVDTPGHWSVTATLPASNKAVVSYPDTQQIYTTHTNQPNPLSGYASITSSYAESSPATSGDDYEAAYDIWANSGSQEIMIWVDNHGQRPSGNDIASATIDGVGYQVWSNGGVGADSTPISLVMDNTQTSGTVNVLDDLKWLESAGYMKSGSGVNQIDFGWELCSTGGTAQTFTLSQYSIKATCTSGSSCTQ